jgi:ATP-dependent DNA helicase PIF1
MNPLDLKKLLRGAGWVFGHLPGRTADAAGTDGVASTLDPSGSTGKQSNTLAPIEPVQVLPEYELARDLVKGGFPLLIVTGGAGTGKSTFIRWLSQSMDGHVLIAAPTGLAALNVEGKTLHSLCALPPAWILERDIKEHKPSIARGAQLLIVDEVSMVNANLLDAVSAFFSKNRGVDKPFGGLPVVLVGDLFQLPPVVDATMREMFARTYKTAKFHGAKALSNSPYYAIELKKAFRQRDQTFVGLLANLREGRELEASLSQINARCTITSEPPDGAVWLSPRNTEVDRRNAAELHRLTGSTRTYHGALAGKFKGDRLPAPMVVELRAGAQVMLTKNGARWVNGSVGTVVTMLEGKVHVRLFDDGDVVEVLPAQWEQYDYNLDASTGRIERVVVGTYTQIPLILAWSITIHKSQGKTIDRVHIDLGAGAFESGQTYVALSRCRSLEKLTLSRPLTPSDIRVDVESQAFYSALRGLINETPPDRMRRQLSLTQS